MTECFVFFFFKDLVSTFFVSVDLFFTFLTFFAFTDAEEDEEAIPRPLIEMLFLVVVGSTRGKDNDPPRPLVLILDLSECDCAG